MDQHDICVDEPSVDDLLDALRGAESWDERTQTVPFVQRVFERLGWPASQISLKQPRMYPFDMFLLVGGFPRLLVEVKKPSSPEFSVEIAPDGSARPVGPADGRVSFRLDPGYTSERWVPLVSGDSNAQLYGYCLNFLDHQLKPRGCAGKADAILPVLTNGRSWVVWRPGVLFDAGAAAGRKGVPTEPLGAQHILAAGHIGTESWSRVASLLGVTA